jgi:hypothetical protein
MVMKTTLLDNYLMRDESNPTRLLFTKGFMKVLFFLY